MFSLEDCESEESPVRIIDKFVEMQDFEKLGGFNAVPAEVGKPSYLPKTLAKLNIYGYENGLRSSRKLERETRQNLEMMWLLMN